MIKKLLSPFITALSPHISHVNDPGGGGGVGTGPIKKKQAELEAIRKRKAAVAKAKAEKLKRDFARRQSTKAIR